jgi:imidazolonepropionase-like amidohydrolase
VTIPEGATIVEGSGLTLMPGLIDSHVHVESSKSLEQSLLFGVTTVLDMFSDYALIAELKKQQQNSTIGKRMADLRSAGTLVTAPGGHGTEYELEIPTLRSGDNVQRFVEERLKEGSDYIKIVYDDWRPSGRSFPTLDKETLKAVIEQAHIFGRMAVVHSLTYNMTREAVDAGCDGLVHLFLGTKPDDEFGNYLKAKGVFVIPTLSVLESVCGICGGKILLENSDFGSRLPKDSFENLKRVLNEKSGLDFGICGYTLRLLKESNVPILAGTDAPNPGTTYGASIHQELELLIEAGLSSLEALSSATSLPAEVFGLKDRGVIAEGMRADLLLVDGDPTQEIKDTRKISKVWKEGTEFDRESPLVTNITMENVNSKQLIKQGAPKKP